MEVAPELLMFNIGGVHIHLISGHDVKYLNELMDSCFCLLSYANQPDGIHDKSSKFKSSVRNCVGDDEDNAIEWDDEFDLNEFYTLETIVHVRIFQYKIARKDLFIGEAKIPLVKILSQLSVENNGKNDDDNNGKNDVTNNNKDNVTTTTKSVLNREIIETYSVIPRYEIPNTGGKLKIGISFTAAVDA